MILKCQYLENHLVALQSTSPGTRGTPKNQENSCFQIGEFQGSKLSSKRGTKNIQIPGWKKPALKRIIILSPKSFQESITSNSKNPARLVIHT